MGDKRWFYVTVQKVVSWNVTVQAEDENEAADVAEGLTLDFDEADYVFEPEAVNVAEVNRYVE